LVKNARGAIEKGCFMDFKRNFLKNYREGLV
jgi:queuine/archaeosine tRNA-ribosyltransferase